MRALCLAAAVLAGCSAPAATPADAGGVDPGIADAALDGAAPPDGGACAEPAFVFGVDVDEHTRVLTDGSTLPITLGFQGFLFVRVGLRTPGQLPPRVNLSVRVTIPGKLDQTTPFQGWPTRAAAGGGSETVDVSVFFNDLPLADLVGQHATVSLSTPSAGCTLAATVDVVLTQGF